MKNLHAQSPKKYPIEVMCRLFGVSKQAYHKQKGQSAVRKTTIEAFALEYIRSVRKTAPGIGGMKICIVVNFPTMSVLDATVLRI